MERLFEINTHCNVNTLFDSEAEFQTFADEDDLIKDTPSQSKLDTAISFLEFKPRQSMARLFEINTHCNVNTLFDSEAEFETFADEDDLIKDPPSQSKLDTAISFLEFKPRQSMARLFEINTHCNVNTLFYSKAQFQTISNEFHLMKHLPSQSKLDTAISFLEFKPRQSMARLFEINTHCNVNTLFDSEAEFETFADEDDLVKDPPSQSKLDTAISFLEFKPRHSMARVF